jgi:hypothetical protein
MTCGLKRNRLPIASQCAMKCAIGLQPARPAPLCRGINGKYLANQ